MSNITFAWDPRKAKANLTKHGISFEEAQSVFLDPNALIIEDPEHSDYEDRFVLLGVSLRGSCLIVNHCYRDADNVIRLISARRASVKEAKEYWRNQ